MNKHKQKSSSNVELKCDNGCLKQNRVLINTIKYNSNNK